MVFRYRMKVICLEYFMIIIQRYLDENKNK